MFLNLSAKRRTVGIIAIPTGIIVAGFNHEISREREAGTEASAVDNMDEEQLLVLQAKVSNRLKRYGYTTTVSNDGEKSEEQ